MLRLLLLPLLLAAAARADVLLELVAAGPQRAVIHSQQHSQPSGTLRPPSRKAVVRPLPALAGGAAASLGINPGDRFTARFALHFRENIVVPVENPLVAYLGYEQSILRFESAALVAAREAGVRVAQDGVMPDPPSVVPLRVVGDYVECFRDKHLRTVCDFAFVLGEDGAYAHALYAGRAFDVVFRLRRRANNQLFRARVEGLRVTLLGRARVGERQGEPAVLQANNQEDSGKAAPPAAVLVAPKPVHPPRNIVGRARAPPKPRQTKYAKLVDSPVQEDEDEIEGKEDDGYLSSATTAGLSDAETVALSEADEELSSLATVSLSSTAASSSSGSSAKDPERRGPRRILRVRRPCRWCFSHGGRESESPESVVGEAATV